MKNLLFTFIFLLNLSMLFGQSEIIYDKTEYRNFIFGFSSNNSVFVSDILKKLADGNSKTLSSVQFQFSFEENCKILKDKKQLQFVTNITKYQISGDTYYKKFDVESFLLPGISDFSFDWYKGNKINDTYVFSNIKIHSNSSILVDKKIQDTILNTQIQSITEQSNKNPVKKNSFIIRDYVFDFERGQKSQFDNYIKMIDEYYFVSNSIQKSTNDLNLIFQNQESLSHLIEIEKIYEIRNKAQYFVNLKAEYSKYDFFTKLPINRTDPEQINQKLKNFSGRSNEFLQSCENVIKNLAEIYYNRAIDKLNQNNPSQADFYFNKSISENPNFAPSHLQLARLYYNSGNRNRAIDKIFEIRRMNPDPQTKLLTIDFAKGIYKDFLLEANDLNNRKNFDQALLVISDAKNLCTNFPEVLCLNNMDIEYSRSINGKYDIILNDIDLFLNKNDLKNAENYIYTAKNYRVKNILLLPDDRDIVIRIEDVYNQYIDNGNNFQKSKNFSRALEQYSEAQRICSNFREIQCTEELNQAIFATRTLIYIDKINEAEYLYNSNKIQSADIEINDAINYRNSYTLSKHINEDNIFEKIKQKLYDNAISEGLQFQRNNDFQSSLSRFESATTIEYRFKINPSKYLKTYINQSAKGLILQKISEGENKVSVNNLPSARKFYTDAINLQSMYSLNDDNNITKALNILKDKIFEQECINAQTEFDNLYKNAINYILNKDFLIADETLRNAINEAGKFSYCGIQTTDVEQKRKEIEQAVLYTQKLNDINKQIKNNDFQNAINSYISLSTFYNSQNIVRFGILHIDLYDFILTKNENFINYTISYYIDNKDFVKSMELLKTLKSKNYNRGLTESNQIKLGIELANEDFRKNSSSNYKENILQYTGNDKFYKQFSKYYKKQWKKID